MVAPKHPVPVFPLPGVVLFPGAVLPLHVFELRYRTMVREALSAERMIGLALLKPGWETDYYGSPDYFPIGCLARFEDVEWLPNDCYDLRVAGLTRVRFGTVVREFPYRAVRVQLLRQDPYLEDDPLIELERQAVAEAFARLLKREHPEAAPPAMSESLTFEALTNAVCMGLALDPEAKLALLEMDSVVDRAQRVREVIEARLSSGEPPKSGGERN
jgi:Lon protease-like protein